MVQSAPGEHNPLDVPTGWGSRVSEAPTMHWVDGRLAPSHVPVLRADDRGFLYGDGAFETLRAVEGRPIGMDRHLARLGATLAALHFPSLTADLRAAAAAVLEANDLRSGEAIVRLRISRGPGAGPRPPARARPTVVVSATRLPEDVRRRRRDGIELATASTPRRALPHLKTASYLASVLALAEAPEGVEPLWCDDAGDVLEGATCNVFVVEAGGLWTPPAAGELLPGIARAVILERARALGLGLDERPLPRSRLAAGPAFVTNAVLQLAPVRRLDGAEVPVNPDLIAALRAGFDACAGA